MKYLKLTIALLAVLTVLFCLDFRIYVEIYQLNNDIIPCTTDTECVLKNGFID